MRSHKCNEIPQMRPKGWQVISDRGGIGEWLIPQQIVSVINGLGIPPRAPQAFSTRMTYPAVSFGVDDRFDADRRDRTKGVCWLKGCTIRKPKRPQTMCPGCGHYFHLQCIADSHLCALRPGVDLHV